MTCGHGSADNSLLTGTFISDLEQQLVSRLDNREKTWVFILCTIRFQGSWSGLANKPFKSSTYKTKSIRAYWEWAVLCFTTKTQWRCFNISELVVTTKKRGFLWSTTSEDVTLFGKCRNTFQRKTGDWRSCALSKCLPWSRGDCCVRQGRCKRHTQRIVCQFEELTQGNSFGKNSQICCLTGDVIEGRALKLQTQ